MMLTLTQIFGALVIFIIARFYVYYQTEVWGLPKPLDYRPFSCQLCLSFWLLLSLSIIFYLLHLPLLASTLLLLNVLNTIAMKVDQQHKTITLEDFEEIVNKGTNNEK